MAAANLVRAAIPGFVDGIDVSHWQGAINWNSVRQAGIHFAFAKATEGVDYIDPRFTQNMAGAAAAGVYIGPYHFARPDSYNTQPLDAANEANDFVDAIAPYYEAPGYTLRPVLDLERLAGVGGVAAERTFLSQWVHNFAAVVEERLGVSPLIYANGSFAQNYLDVSTAEYDLWLANWNYSPPSTPPPSASGVFGDWTLWQYTSTGSVPGISGNVDRDVFRGSVDEMLESLLAIQPTSADFDQNEAVDGGDFLIWQRGFGSGSSLAQGDADHDGDVAAADLAVWQSQFGTGAAAATALAVAEPAAAALAMAAAAFLCVVRARREFTLPGGVASTVDFG